MKSILGILPSQETSFPSLPNILYQRRAHNNSRSSLSGEMEAKPLLINSVRKTNGGFNINILTDKEQRLISLARKRFF
jgi:hypothetical protein